jgi:TonB family protein
MPAHEHAASPVFTGGRHHGPCSDRTCHPARARVSCFEHLALRAHRIGRAHRAARSASACAAARGAKARGKAGVDEAGASGTDSFGLAGKPGGRELLLTGAGGGGGNPNGRYLQFASQIQAYIKDQLNQVASLTQDCYTVNVAVWVAATGSIDDVRIRKSTGDRILDSEIRSALLQLAPMDPAPPSDMPWPVILQMVAHRADCKPESASTAPRSSY